MRILFLTSKFWPNIGGVERHVLKISEELIKRGNEVSVITELSPDLKNNKNNNYQSIEQSDTDSIKSKEGVKSVYFEHYKFKKIGIYYFKFGKKGWFKKFRIWWILLKNKNIIQNADIVHCHDVFFWCFPFRFLYPHKKTFTTFHGYESYPIKSKAVIIRKISEILSNGTICVGEFMKKWYHAKPDYIIYGATDHYDNIKEIKTPSALFYGRLDDQTGIMTYIEAVKLIREKIPEFKLEIVGEGRLRKKIKVPVKKFDQKIEGKISKFRFLFVSRYLSILEGLVSHRPVFAVFDNPLKRDYLQMSPFKKYIHISGNAEDLASKVLSCIEQKESGEKTQQGYEWARKQTWGKIAETYLKLWKI